MDAKPQFTKHDKIVADKIILEHLDVLRLNGPVENQSLPWLAGLAFYFGRTDFPYFVPNDSRYSGSLDAVIE
jgi:hypothetical protein